ncbi:histidine phosphatase family protein [Streptomyces sp. NPDC001999]
MVDGMTRLVLVRHARPEVLPQVPAELWELDEQGRAAARALASLVPDASYHVSSDEPKALQTVQELSGGREVAAEPGFREVRRPHRWADDYRLRARAYVDGLQQDGWEPHAQVVARFDAAVSRHARIAAARRQTLVVGTHGLAPIVWLASRLCLHPTPGHFWASLAFPDLIDVDLGAKRAERRCF